jgi:hypothetical protein
VERIGQSRPRVALAVLSATAQTHGRSRGRLVSGPLDAGPDAREGGQKAHRIRRIGAYEVLTTLRQKPIQVAPGTAEAATAHIRTLAVRLKVVNRQIKDAHRQLDALCATLAGPEEVEPGQSHEQC